jgi:hypothetical protein
MTTEKTTAWTEDERREMAEQAERDNYDAYERDAHGNKLRVKLDIAQIPDSGRIRTRGVECPAVASIQTVAPQAAPSASTMSDDPTDIPGLEQRVEAMRRLGVTEWGSIKLGPVPQGEAKTETQQESSDARERRVRADQRTLALAASGRLVPRLVQDRE